MIDFIIKYWLQILFSLIAGGLGWCAKHYYSLWKKEKQRTQDDLVTTIKDELKAYNQDILAQKEDLLNQEDVKLQQAINDVRSSNERLLNVVLGVYKKQFRTDCRYLLETTNSITFEQFDSLQEQFDLYKTLSGKEAEDRLFNLVQEKYSGQMMQQDQVELLAKQFKHKE